MSDSEPVVETILRRNEEESMLRLLPSGLLLLNGNPIGRKDDGDQTYLPEAGKKLLSILMLPENVDRPLSVNELGNRGFRPTKNWVLRGYFRKALEELAEIEVIGDHIAQLTLGNKNYCLFSTTGPNSLNVARDRYRDGLMGRISLKEAGFSISTVTWLNGVTSDAVPEEISSPVSNTEIDSPPGDQHSTSEVITPSEQNNEKKQIQPPKHIILKHHKYMMNNPHYSAEYTHYTGLEIVILGAIFSRPLGSSMSIITLKKILNEESSFFINIPTVGIARTVGILFVKYRGKKMNFLQSIATLKVVATPHEGDLERHSPALKLEDIIIERDRIF